MENHFEKGIDRRGTNSFKYDFRKEFFGREDVIPLWVADMDLPAPDFVQQAVTERARHPVYGYTILPDSYYRSIINWQKERHGWQIEKDWIRHSPGIVTAINLLVQALTQPGDPVIVQPPVYFPFFWAVEKNGRKLLNNVLVEENGRYRIDFNDLEGKLDSGAKMLILCSPHNPVGRVWEKQELERMARLCLQYDAIIVSDEIHCDLVYEGYRHTPTAKLSDEIAAKTITCIAPSKTFNLAGLATSSIIISDEGLRKQFQKEEEKIHLSSNIFGVVASEAAYANGAGWVDELMVFLKGNVELVKDFLAVKLPEVKLIHPESTYLLWLDFRGFGLSDKKTRKILVEKAGVGMNDGRMFGPGGVGFQRMNIGCPPSTLEKALENIAGAFR
jgi:cystathionine beta-lyase